MPNIKLTNMKMEPRKEPETVAAPAPDRPIYPWGLQLNLDEDALKKLGISDLPKVGKPLMVVARADVTGISEAEHTGDDKGTHRHRSVSLQITDLGLGAEQDEKDAQEVLYEG